MQLVQSDIAYHFGIIPKEINNQKLELFIKEENIELYSIEEIALILEKEIILEPVSSVLINQALATYYRNSESNNSKKDFKLGNDFLKEMIWDAKSTGSSDIHFEVFRELARVRFRIDGKLLTRYTIQKDEYAELVNKIKIEAKLNITEKRLPQDGRINYESFDIRVSILPTMHGEKIVMRILGRDTSNLSIESLGMNADEEKIYIEAISASKGIILISGPTGSGKTTTLYATLKLLNKESTNIMTIEDPIEYTMPGINQVQLREDIGLTFTSALKTFLRQDPDIIMLGEIRDEKTAQMAIRASLTGHLVLSTIHTNSAIGTISRLIDMGVPPFLIAETLRISVAQRLVRRLCNHCKIKSNEIPDLLINTGYSDEHFMPVGCNKCFQTGYKGRIAIYELIPITQKVIKLIKSDANITENTEYKNLSGKAKELVSQGVTSLQEVYSILIEEKINQ